MESALRAKLLTTGSDEEWEFLSREVLPVLVPALAKLGEAARPHLNVVLSSPSPPSSRNSNNSGDRNSATATPKSRRRERHHDWNDEELVQDFLQHVVLPPVLTVLTEVAQMQPLDPVVECANRLKQFHGVRSATTSNFEPMKWLSRHLLQNQRENEHGPLRKHTNFTRVVSSSSTLGSTSSDSASPPPTQSTRHHQQQQQQRTHAQPSRRTSRDGRCGSARGDALGAAVIAPARKRSGSNSSSGRSAIRPVRLSRKFSDGCHYMVEVMFQEIADLPWSASVRADVAIAARHMFGFEEEEEDAFYLVRCRVYNPDTSTYTEACTFERMTHLNVVRPSEVAHELLGHLHIITAASGQPMAMFLLGCVAAELPNDDVSASAQHPESDQAAAAAPAPAPAPAPVPVQPSSLQPAQVLKSSLSSSGDEDLRPQRPERPEEEERPSTVSSRCEQEGNQQVLVCIGLTSTDSGPASHGQPAVVVLAAREAELSAQATANARHGSNNGVPVPPVATHVTYHNRMPQPPVHVIDEPEDDDGDDAAFGGRGYVSGTEHKGSEPSSPARRASPWMPNSSSATTPAVVSEYSTSLVLPLNGLHAAQTRARRPFVTGPLSQESPLVFNPHRPFAVMGAAISERLQQHRQQQQKQQQSKWNREPESVAAGTGPVAASTTGGGDRDGQHSAGAVPEEWTVTSWIFKDLLAEFVSQISVQPAPQGVDDGNRTSCTMRLLHTHVREVRSSLFRRLHEAKAMDSAASSLLQVRHVPAPTPLDVPRQVMSGFPTATVASSPPKMWSPSSGMSPSHQAESTGVVMERPRSDASSASAIGRPALHRADIRSRRRRQQHDLSGGVAGAATSVPGGTNAAGGAIVVGPGTSPLSKKERPPRPPVMAPLPVPAAGDGDVAAPVRFYPVFRRALKVSGQRGVVSLHVFEAARDTTLRVELYLPSSCQTLRLEQTPYDTSVFADALQESIDGDGALQTPTAAGATPRSGSGDSADSAGSAQMSLLNPARQAAMMICHRLVIEIDTSGKPRLLFSRGAGASVGVSVGVQGK